MDSKFHIEVNSYQKNYEGERICGDVFITRKIKEENRIITVLSDGMGHGVKANILATLTATMAVNFSEEHKDSRKIAEIIMNTLPVCSERQISYSTFTIIDIDADGEVRILEYDNPQCIILRGTEVFEPEWTCIYLNTEKNTGKELLSCSFKPRKEDRIIFCSDGVTQSGMGGNDKYLFGWSRDTLQDYIHGLVKQDRFISAERLASKVVNKAHANDNYQSKDDTTCAVIYMRDPRKLLLCTGPPYEKNKDEEYASIVRDFVGQKILCGATTCDIISREFNAEITDSFEFNDPDLPPVSYMEGVDLITEGILTLSKVSEILRAYSNQTKLGKGPADLIVKMILESDEIHMVIGTRINIAHQDPSLPVELEIRRTVVKRIARLLEEKFLKEVSMSYI